jgi:hypothetical protein
MMSDRDVLCDEPGHLCENEALQVVIATVIAGRAGPAAAFAARVLLPDRPTLVSDGSPSQPTAVFPTRSRWPRDRLDDALKIVQAEQEGRSPGAGLADGPGRDGASG